MFDLNNVPNVIKELLKINGIKTKADIFDYFNQDIYSLANPFEIKDIDTFISRLKEAIEAEENILIYGDKDADGITAASIMYNTLKIVTKNVEAFVPNHDTGYGLSKSVIEDYASRGFTLIITVDCGISNYEEVKCARELGVDIIVTDHHDIPDTLPKAYMIFNPKLPDTGFADKNYSGCAVAYKLMQAFVYSYTKFYNKYAVVLDYEIEKNTNEIKYIKALKLKNFLIQEEIFAFEKTKDGYKEMFTEYYDEYMNEESVLEELCGFMFEEDRVMIVLTGGEIRFKKLISIFEKYDISPPDFDSIYNILELGSHYGNINLKTVKTLDEFATLLKINVYKFENSPYSDMLIKAEIFRRVFYLSQSKLVSYMNKKAILATLGTVADIIPLIGESRVYVKTGLNELTKTNHIRYKTILSKINLDSSGKIDTTAISWRLAPFINAAGRMGRPEEALKLLTCEDEESALKLTDVIFSLNESRKTLTEENFNVVCYEIDKNSLDKEDIIIIKSDKVELGLTGLISGRIVSKYKKPAIVLSENTIEGICVASARSEGTDNVREMLEKLSILLIKYGGHKNAAGFSIETKNFDAFVEEAKAYAKNNFTTDVKEEKHYTLKLSFNDITLNLAEHIEMLEPFGCGNDEPIFASYNIKISSVKNMGKNGKLHLKINFSSEGKILTGLYWSADDELFNRLNISELANIFYKIKVNRFNGKSEVNLVLESIECL